MTEQHKSVRLEEVFAKRSGSVDPAKFPDEIFELLSIPAFDVGQPEVITGAEIGSTKQVVQPGDVLLSKIVPHIRRAWIVKATTEHRLIASSEWIVFRDKRFDPRYLRHLLVSDVFHRQFMQTVSGIGGSLLRARPSEVAKIEVPSPPLGEQIRITSVLDKVDGLRHLRKEALRLTDKLLLDVFLKLFGDPEENPHGFRRGRIRDLVETANYGTSEKANEISGEFPILRMNNITYSGQWDFTSIKYVDLPNMTHDKFLAKRGDVLFNRTNSVDLVGKTAVYEGERSMAIAGYLVRVRTNSTADPYYLSGYLNSAHGKATLKAMAKSIVGMANINAQEMQEIPILIPPIELQHRYRQIVEAVRAAQKTQQESLTEIEAIGSALSARSFSLH